MSSERFHNRLSSRPEESQLATEVARVRYQTLFDFVPDAYLETDANGTILEANRAARRLPGAEPGRLRGRLLVPARVDRNWRRTVNWRW